MLELTVGSRFWYKDKLFEVVQGGESGCIYCAFRNRRKCRNIKCSFYERHDENDVYFKEVK